MTTSYPCPHCGAPASLPDGCPHCGAGPDSEAAEVIRLDGEIADLDRRLRAARMEVVTTERHLQAARDRRAALAARVVARRTPTPPASAPPASVPPVPSPLPVSSLPPRDIPSAEPRLSTITVQNVLFTLGGLLLVVAAAVFTAVAWAQVGVTGRALLLAAATAAILAIPPFAVRRGLTAAAETFAAVGLLMILLDGYAAWTVDFLAVRDLDPSAYAAAVLTTTSALSVGYARRTHLRGPRIAALLIAQPVAPLLAAAADADLTGWSLSFLATLLLDITVLRLRSTAAPATAAQPGTTGTGASPSGLAGPATPPHPSTGLSGPATPPHPSTGLSGPATPPHPSTGTDGTEPAAGRLIPADAVTVLTYLCGGSAAAISAVTALADLSLATTPASAAQAGGILLLTPIALFGWAFLIRSAIAQAITAGLLVVTAGLAGARWAWTLPIEFANSTWQSTRLAAVALVLAAATALLRRFRTTDGRPLFIPTTPHPAHPSGAPRSGAVTPTSQQTGATRPGAVTPSAQQAGAAPHRPGPGSGDEGATGVWKPQPTGDGSTGTSEAASGHRGGKDARKTIPRPGEPGRPDNAGRSGQPGQPGETGQSGETGRSGAPSRDATSGLSGETGSGRTGGRAVADVAGFGAWVGALLVGVVPALAMLVSVAGAAIVSVEAARPVLGTPLDVAIVRTQPDALVAAVLTVVAYLLLLPRSTHLNLILTASAGVALLLPSAFGLLWWAVPVADVAVAAAALALGAGSRTTRDVSFRTALCGGLLLHAVVTGFGHAGVAAAVLAAITVLGAGVGVLLRSRPSGDDLGAGGFTVGLIAAGPAVWLALLAADTSATTRVRASLAVVVLLCLVAHLVVRELAVYSPHALGVALAAAGSIPLWAGAGTDPVALYAATALLLIASLLPIRTTGTIGGSVTAALVPILALLILTGPDLAVVLAEPWTATNDIWSGVAPHQSAAAWSSVAALALTAVAAAWTGWLLTRFPLLTATSGSANGTTDRSTTGDSTAESGVGWGGAEEAETGAGRSSVQEAGIDTGRNSEEAATNVDRSGQEVATNAGRSSDEEAGTGRGGDQEAGIGAGRNSKEAVTGVIRGGGAVAEAPSGGSRWKGRSPWAVAVLAAMPLVALVVPMVFAAARAPWPVVPIVDLVVGLAGLLALAYLPRRDGPADLLTVLFGALAAAGVAGSSAAHGPTMVAFGLVAAAGAVAGAAGRRTVARVTGWAAGTVSVVVLAYTVADAADLGPAAPPLFVLGAAALVVALEWVLASHRPREAVAPFAVAHASALAALLITDSLGWAALVCKLWALVLSVRAMRPGETRGTRFRYAVAAACVALIGWWLLLSSQEVGTTEVYTFPAAVLAAVIGWFARRSRPDLPSWTAYGPALGAAFLPSLTVIAHSSDADPHHLRRLLLGVGALLVLLAGSRARLQAPVVTGGATLTLVALHELVRFWDLLPRWVPLAVGGLLLVGVATTIEQRRRDLARFRAALNRMT
ncbi:SCO7613 C-terminal domain-containing membrane protein [Actinoplanes utahensis]|uniref:Uncharacterized protein n=1 Tax=Actinoplanes utahensis TaxID=1869 RepID=A0A0A6UY11_ACTUT|nr:hypothetical protein [Actinoplanes utahensis]KHD79279.1 hypothetical protein MB27_01395 [Actinoplanes utahensis]GIF30275.1 hypothetical protein Aut01nite_32610 [Actinoplanes utahensis]